MGLSLRTHAYPGNVWGRDKTSFLLFLLTYLGLLTYLPVKSCNVLAEQLSSVNSIIFVPKKFILKFILGL